MADVPGGNFVLFDDGVGLSPLDDLRCSFDIRTGALTLHERISLMRDEAPAVIARPGLAGVCAEARGGVGVHADASSLPSGWDVVTLLNGRSVHPPDGLSESIPNTVYVDEEDGSLVAAVVRRSEVGALLGEGPGRLASAGSTRVVRLVDFRMLRRPWHVRTHRNHALGIDLTLLVERLTLESGGEESGSPGGSVTVIGMQRLAVSRTARVYAGATLDCERGPIVIADGAVVRPGAVVQGPGYVGPGSTVMDLALVRAGTAIGPSCKIGGETGGTIWQGFANKAHHGYIGDSWVGEWVNLGAGTTGSNLLNTYGEVRMSRSPGLAGEPTGERFLGALIGDHVKTAINTSISTGAVLGTGVMYADHRPARGHVAPFGWVVEDGVARYDADRFVEVMRRVMERRGREPGASYVAAVRSLALRA